MEIREWRSGAVLFTTAFDLVRDSRFGQAITEDLSDAVVAPIILMQPISVEIADHLVDRDTAFDMPVAHNFETAEEPDVMLGGNGLNDAKHLLRGGRRRLVFWSNAGAY
ncbi:hypothetical protein QA641_06305 [Bradyrhizobium sp. CB1650]|uniref:hypothetical protein n=1 Tax=Bradyrhizobium sp. CB1650 TaxID=3039153 RepID=UPI00243538F6|nr:hypothetical protein [Bradyrhizobium sp. CB1650]WGD53523.1 hypothetical protein QA641_06305 [Bradyrhizobium sp. CB1650]